VIDASGKEIGIEHVEGPMGVQARNPSTSSGHRFDKAKIKSLGWEAETSLKEGITRTYPWIEQQVKTLEEAE
jgi:nucleoside-diphosphate-sugar epimerase